MKKMDLLGWKCGECIAGWKKREKMQAVVSDNRLHFSAQAPFFLFCGTLRRVLFIPPPVFSRFPSLFSPVGVVISQ